MKSEKYNYAAMVKGELFDQNSLPYSVGFHVTSSYFSKSIEKDGFKINNSVYKKQIDKLIYISDKFKVDARALKNNIKMASISFAPLSSQCLDYASKDKLGGQVSVFAIRALDDIEVAIKSRNIITKSFYAFKCYFIRSFFKKIKQHSAVIYAVDLSGVPPSHINYNTLTKSFHVSKSIHKENIHAKMDLSGFNNEKPPSNIKGILGNKEFNCGNFVYDVLNR
ncbi:TPA: hypothetical protein ACMDPN_003480 [Vibrio cholerae]|nr:hypothetical protein [Vibrio cholerae]EKF9817604.1 hypothetical protein [Vibrio cholerae]